MSILLSFFCGLEPSTRFEAERTKRRPKIYLYKCGFMYLDGLVLARKNTLVTVEAFVGPGRKSGWLLPCCKTEDLVLESFCDTAHVQVTVVTLQLPSKVA